MTGLLGVPAIDAILGKAPKWSRILIRNDPGTDGALLLRQAIGHRATKGDIVVVTWDRSPAALRAAMARYGEQASARVIIVDANSGAFSHGQAADHHIDEPRDLARVAAALERIAAGNPGAWLAVDSLSGALDGGDREGGAALVQAFARFPLTLASWTAWPYMPPPEDLLAAFEAEIALRAVEQGVVRNESIRVERVDWRSTFDDKARIIAAGDDGYHVVVPKVVVTGPADAGKSTLIGRLSKRAVSAERNGTTVAIDRGRYEAPGLTVELWGTPGQARFAPLMKQVLGAATGVVVVVDATSRASFSDAKDIIAEVRKRGLSVAVPANKQDGQGALTAAEVHHALDLPAAIPVVGCTATDVGDARRALEDILNTIIDAEVAA